MLESKLLNYGTASGAENLVYFGCGKPCEKHGIHPQEVINIRLGTCKRNGIVKYTMANGETGWFVYLNLGGGQFRG